MAVVTSAPWGKVAGFPSLWGGQTAAREMLVRPVWGITEPVMCLCQCCSLDPLAKLLRCSLVIKRRIGCWSLRVEPCLLQLSPHVPSIPTHQETDLGMELEKIGGALKAVQSFEPK